MSRNLFTNGLVAATILSNLDTYGNLVTRGPVQPQIPDLPGPITDIDQRYINLGRVKIEGIDFDSSASELAGVGMGQLYARYNGTYYTKWDEEQIDGSIISRVANQYEASTTGLLPRYKHYATLNWSRGPWSATLGNLYQNGYTDCRRSTSTRTTSRSAEVEAFALGSVGHVHRFP